MELKEGMYVRYIRSFKDNNQEKPVVEIDKVRSVDERVISLENWLGNVVYDLNSFKIFLTKEPSFDLIDICEAGDYVNGNKVININGDLFVNGEGALEDIVIKSIVTKEMFESMNYKVDDAK